MISDHRTECGNKHERLLQVLRNYLLTKFGSSVEVNTELLASIGENASRVKTIADDASQRMSFAIFISATLSLRKAVCAATMASREPCASHLFGAVINGQLVSLASSPAIAVPNSF